MNYRGRNGFPVRWEHEIDTYYENEFLFGLYEWVFTDNKPKELHKFYVLVALLSFPNHIESSVPEKDISHDQLTAYSCYSFLTGAGGHGRIYRDIKGIKYKGRIQHPRDIIYYALLNKKPLGFLLLPLLYLLCAFSMLVGYRIKDGKIVPKLSGELLWVLRYKTAENHVGLRIAMFPCKLLVRLGAFLRYGSVKSMIRTYFNNFKGHPIVEEVKNV